MPGPGTLAIMAEAVGLAASAASLPEGAAITGIGIIGLPDKMTNDQAVELASGLLRRFHELVAAGNALMWCIGDAYAHGERLHGSDFEDAMAATGYRPQTVSNAVWVARKIAYEDRRADLSFTHHECVAALEPDEQRQILAQAAEQEWSTRELVDMVREKRDRDDGLDPDVCRATRALERAAAEVTGGLWTSQWMEAIVDGLLEPLRRRAHSPDGWRAFLMELRARVDEMLKGE